MHCPPFLPMKIPSTHFDPRSIVRPGGLGKFTEPVTDNLRTDPPACSIALPYALQYAVQYLTLLQSLPTNRVEENNDKYEDDVFWDVTPCGSFKNRRFGGTWRLQHRCNKNRWTRNVAVTNNRRKKEPHGVTSHKTTFFITLTCYHHTDWGRNTSHSRRLRSYGDVRQMPRASEKRGLMQRRLNSAHS
jgi:hypothetical protein